MFCFLEHSNDNILDIYNNKNFFYRLQEVRFKVHDPKAHSKGGTLENTINGGRAAEEENTGPPPHILHPGKVIKYLNCFSQLMRNQFLTIFIRC